MSRETYRWKGCEGLPPSKLISGREWFSWWDARCCAVCGGVIRPDETVHLYSGRVQLRCCFVAYCEECHRGKPLPWQRNKRDVRPCVVCGRQASRPVTHQSNLPRYCCEEHRRTAHNGRHKAKAKAARLAAVSSIRCHVCGSSFLPKRTDAKTCSPRCRQQMSRKARSERAAVTDSQVVT